MKSRLVKTRIQVEFWQELINHSFIPNLSLNLLKYGYFLAEIGNAPKYQVSPFYPHIKKVAHIQ